MLYEHQKRIIEDDKKFTGIWLGTGSGKTRTTLLLAQGKTLVICPKTQRDDGNWEREVKKMQLEIPLTVLSKEDFKKHASSLARFDTIIIDEAHTALGVTPSVRWKKGKQYPKTSQLFEALVIYLLEHEPSRLYLVTATPDRSPMTVWGAGRLLGKKWDFFKFRDAFYTKLPIPGREIYKPRGGEEVKNRLAKLVQSIGHTGQLSDYFDVPDQTYKTIFVELTTQQKTIIKDLTLDYPDPLVLCGKRHQVENGSLAGNEFEEGHMFGNEKLEKIVDLAAEFPRMVIFAKYRGQIAQIASRLIDEGKKVLILTGDTKDRGAVIKAANEAKECVFIAQAQISSGWELPMYPVMVFASMSYSFVDRTQGEGRIHRANALKKNLYIDLVVKGGVDEAVHKAIANKKDFHERIYIEQT